MSKKNKELHSPGSKDAHEDIESRTGSRLRIWRATIAIDHYKEALKAQLTTSMAIFIARAQFYDRCEINALLAAREIYASS